MKKNTPRNFWKNVDIRLPLDCWPWQAGKVSGGYGMFWMNGLRYRAHRFAYESAHGPIPEGAVIRHSCDNPGCCNPQHLLSGTVADNNRDTVERGRHITPSGEANGRSKLTASQVVEIRQSNDTLRALGKRYGVHHITIWQIKHGLRWPAEQAKKGAGAK